MTTIRCHSPDSDPLQVLKSALGLSIADMADTRWTVAANVLRRIAAVHAPCARGNLIRRARHALEPVFSGDLADVLHEILDDLVAGGDLTEQFGLCASHEQAPMMLFLLQPCFSVTEQRIYLHGVAADDAPCIPKSVSGAMVCSGALRFLESGNLAETAELLRKLGLAESDAEQRMVSPHELTPRNLVDHYRACLDSQGRTEPLQELRWLSSDSSLPYRRRWSTAPCAQGLQIARAPQFYGADAWLLFDHGASTSRYVQLPISGLRDERGCDAAWRLQLAIDTIAGSAATYRIEQRDGMACVYVDFPLPLWERRKLLHFGGLRQEAARPHDFILPSDVLPMAKSLLAQLNFEPITTESK